MAYKPHKFVREKSARKESRTQFWNIFAIEGLLFSLTLALALWCAFLMDKLSAEKKIFLPQNSLQDFFASFAFVTFFILVFVSFKSKKLAKFKGAIYKSLFLLAVFWGGMAAMDLFMPALASVLVMGFLIGFWLKRPYVLLHDLLMVLALAGSASFFGLGFSPSAVIALLLVFSVYDFIAVYKTKHMVAMAKELIEEKAIMGFVVPKKYAFFRGGLEEVKPAGNYMILGGGDVVFPALLAVSLVPVGILESICVALFSLAGLFCSYYIFQTQKDKEPIPALPPIALFSIIGYLATLFF